MSRPVSRVNADIRKVVRGRDAKWLKCYIGRNARKMIIAEQELVEQGGFPVLSPAARQILERLHYWLTQ